MKKFITVAALVAAGTALASAGTDTSNWTQVFSYEGTISTGTASLSSLGMTGSYNYASYSWCVSFTLDTSSKNSGCPVFSTSAEGDYGLEALINTTSGYLNIASTDGVHRSYPNTAGSGGDSSEAVFDTTATSLDVSLTWYADTEQMVLSTGSYDTTFDMSGGSSFIQYASLTGDSYFTATGVSGTTPISNIKVTVNSTSDVPEPSMFGLLAGLGAIGLVATRRRRNRKA